LPLKIPEPAGKLLTLRVADPEFFIDFEFADKDPVTLVSAPSGCVVTVAKPKPLAASGKQKLTESFFTNLAPGTNLGSRWRARPSSPAHDAACGGRQFSPRAGGERVRIRRRPRGAGVRPRAAGRRPRRDLRGKGRARAAQKGRRRGRPF
jgi:uncharacterized protein DUF1007